jgi:hypothetical protein
MTSAMDKSANPFIEPRYIWLGKWTVSGQLVVEPDTMSSTGIDIEALKIGIQTDGFYLWNADGEPLPDGLQLMR